VQASTFIKVPRAYIITASSSFSSGSALSCESHNLLPLCLQSAPSWCMMDGLSGPVVRHQKILVNSPCAHPPLLRDTVSASRLVVSSVLMPCSTAAPVRSEAVPGASVLLYLPRYSIAKVHHSGHRMSGLVPISTWALRPLWYRNRKVFYNSISFGDPLIFRRRGSHDFRPPCSLAKMPK
jgi:hypothetical protein